MSDLVVSDKKTLFQMGPREMVESATSMAGVLKDVIEKQQLYTAIQGKKHVRVEGWQVIGAMMGIVPKEVSVIEQPDGSYISEVQLINISNGLVVGGASSLCSIDEKRWGSADKYARRSMATTRATGKAFRLTFSWVMTLAGYEPTPFEEMPLNLPPIVVSNNSAPTGEVKPAPPVNSSNDRKQGLASIAQIKRLWAIAKSKGMHNDYVHALVKKKYGIDSVNDLNWKQYKEFTDEIQQDQFAENTSEEPPMPPEPLEDIPF